MTNPQTSRKSEGNTGEEGNKKENAEKNASKNALEDLFSFKRKEILELIEMIESVWIDIEALVKEKPGLEYAYEDLDEVLYTLEEKIGINDEDLKDRKDGG